MLKRWITAQPMLLRPPPRSSFRRSALTSINRCALETLRHGCFLRCIKRACGCPVFGRANRGGLAAKDLREVLAVQLLLKLNQNLSARHRTHRAERLKQMRRGASTIGLSCAQTWQPTLPCIGCPAPLNFRTSSLPRRFPDIDWGMSSCFQPRSSRKDHM